MKFLPYNGLNLCRAAKLLFIVSILLFFRQSSFGQNTKGDRTEVRGGSAPRQTRFTTKRPKRAKARAGSRRITPQKVSLARISRFFEGRNSNVYSSRDRRFVNNKHRKPDNNQRPWRDNGSSSFVGQSSLKRNQNVYPQKKRRVSRGDSDKARNVYSKTSQYVSNSHSKPSDKQKAWKGSLSGSRIKVRTTKVPRNSNVYSRYGQYSSNPSPRPHSTQQSASNRGGRRKVTPRSASRSFIHQRTINTNAGFWNVKKKAEVPVTTDLAGRPLRTRNFQTPAREVISPKTKSYSRSKRIGDHPYKGSSGARVSTRTTSSRAWSGDIAGRRIRGRNFTSKSNVESVGTSALKPLKRNKSRRGDRIYKGIIPGGGYNSITGKRRRVGLLQTKTPGIGANGIGGFKGNIKSFRPIKGGGSRSGALWNNKGTAIFGKQPGVGADGLGTFQGNLKGSRPLRGGGSRSGRLWNNKGIAILGKQPGIGVDGVGTFQGNLKGSRPLRGGGSRSGRLWNNKGIAILGKQPGIGVDGVGNFQGNLKGSRPLRGGGSRSGRLWNNKGIAILGKQPGIGVDGVGAFQGNLKGSRPLRGGGSRSGRLWNNKGVAIPGRQPGIGVDGLGGFQGNIKNNRPFKGGGSRSGRLWNNNGIPIQSKQPGLAAQGDWTIHGNIKAKKPLKGGGSRSGRLWNNNGVAIQGRPPGVVLERMGSFQGNIATRKPLKGGGSVSGRLWNNKTKPLNVRPPSSQAAKAGGFPGKIKTFEQSPGFNNQGEEFTGYTKLHRFNKKSYVQNENSSDEAIKKKRPSKSTYDVDDLQFKVKRRDYVQNKNSAEAALRKLEPTKSTLAGDGLQIRIKRRDYVQNKNSAEAALRKLEPTKSTLAGDGLQVRVKKYNYIHNSNSAKEALKVREPGRAFAMSSNYKGNIQVKKFDLSKLFSQKEQHPDTKFIKLNKNNVAEERSVVTNIKLWWARTFKKNDTQPENLKDKGRKPRYDKGEQGLWND